MKLRYVQINKILSVYKYTGVYPKVQHKLKYWYILKLQAKMPVRCDVQTKTFTTSTNKKVCFFHLMADRTDWLCSK